MHMAADTTDTTPQQRVRVMPFIVMMSGLASQSLLFGVPPPLVPAMAASLGSNGAFVAQMVFAIASLGLMITAICSGLVIRLLGVRSTIILALVIYAIAGIVPWVTSDVGLVLGSRFLTGGGCGLLTTGCTMLLAHYYTGIGRSKALGYQTSVGSASGLVALFIAGWLMQTVGWHVPFLIYGLAALPILALAIVGVPHIPVPPRSTTSGMGDAFLRIWPIMIAAGLLLMVPLMIGGNVPLLLNAIGVTNSLIVSIVIAMVSTASTVSGLLFSRIWASLGVRQTFAGSLVCGAVGMACVGLGSTAFVVGLGCAFVGFAVGLFIPHLWMLGTSLVPEAIRGHAIGLLSTSMFLGGFLYPFVVQVLERAFGLAGAVVAIAVILLVAAVVMLIARRSRLAGGTVLAATA